MVQISHTNCGRRIDLRLVLSSRDVRFHRVGSGGHVWPLVYFVDEEGEIRCIGKRGEFFSQSFRTGDTVVICDAYS